MGLWLCDVRGGSCRVSMLDMIGFAFVDFCNSSGRQRRLLEKAKSCQLVKHDIIVFCLYLQTSWCSFTAPPRRSQYKDID